MMAILSFLWSYGLVILPLLLVAVGLGYVAFILKNWRAALAAVGIVIVVLAAGSLYTAGIKHEHARVLAEQRRIVEERIATFEAVSARYAERAAADAARIEELQRLVDQTPPNSAPGIPKDAAERIGNIR